MKKDLEKIIDVPEEVTARQDGNEIIIKGNFGENKRKFNFGDIEIKIEDRKLFLKKKKANKKDKKNLNSIGAHIRNMIRGVSKPYEYSLEICSVHFPMTVRIDKNKMAIKNFIGERKERIVNILPGVEIEIKGNHILVKSCDKEKAGLQATLIEHASKISGKDRRVFQDGIWIVKKEKGK